MRNVFSGLAALLVLTAAAPAQDPLDNLTPTQKLLFENEWVKVIDDQIPPGGVEPMHRHRHGIVTYLVDYKTDDTTPDGKLVHQSRTKGTAFWSNPITHSVRNVDNHTSHAVRIELKRADPPPPPAPEPLDSLKLSAITQKLIFENEFVRVIDDVIPVGVTEPMHHHPHGLVIYLTDNYVTEQIRPDGSTSRNTRKLNEVSWGEPLTHAVKNIGTETSHAIRVELKY